MDWGHDNNWGIEPPILLEILTLHRVYVYTVSSLVLIAQAVFLLQRGDIHKVTDAADHPIPPIDYAGESQ